MKLNYDGHTVSFTPQSEDDLRLLSGFAHLDAVVDSFKDVNSSERLHQFALDNDVEIYGAISFLRDTLVDESLFDEEPPEDEDEDESQTVPGSID